MVFGTTYEDKEYRAEVFALLTPWTLMRFAVKARELMDYHNFILSNFYRTLSHRDVGAMIEETLDAVNYFEGEYDTNDLVHRSRRWQGYVIRGCPR